MCFDGEIVSEMIFRANWILSLKPRPTRLYSASSFIDRGKSAVGAEQEAKSLGFVRNGLDKVFYRFTLWGSGGLHETR